MDKKNDVQCSTSVENVKFCVKVGFQNRQIVGKKDQTLKDAMADLETNLATSNCIIFAKVKDRDGEVAVPHTLLCGWLKKDTTIQLEKIPGSKKIGSPMTGHQTKLDQQTIFFVKMDDRKNKRSITTISYVDYKCKDLCVIANYGDTFLEALEKDGRFTNPENFELLNEGKCTSNSLQAKDFPNEVFSVSFKRSVNRKRNADPKTEVTLKGIPLGDCTNTARGVIVKKEPQDANISTPFSELATEDRYQVVVTKVKSKAYELFLHPSKAKDKETRHKAICEFVKQQFSKTVDQSKPAWLIESIASATKLVGRIFCGCITATCFLVAKDIIMTNLHVYHDIQKERQNSGLPDTHKKARVRFNDKYPNQVMDLVEVEVQIDEVIAQSSDYQLDYVLLGLKDHDQQVLRDQVELCDVVFQNATADPTDGLVTIIGHPGGQPKAVDTDCRIISEYLWRDQVQKRVLSARPDSYFYLSQKIKTDVMEDEFGSKLAYDTSFFTGASGSLVLNDQGLVIAMHTCGYEIDKISPNAISVMEFGVSMAAISKDLYQRNPSLATMLFSNVPMDVEP